MSEEARLTQTTKRIVDWDVDGLSVWCNAPGCTNRWRCEACELTAEAESILCEVTQNPMVNRTQGEAMEKRAKELLALAEELDAPFAAVVAASAAIAKAEGES